MCCLIRVAPVQAVFRSKLGGAGAGSARTSMVIQPFTQAHLVLCCALGYYSLIQLKGKNLNRLVIVISEIYEVPAYFTSDAMYRDFFSGAGYIMPWWTLSCLYQQSLKLPYFFVEDVFLTGWIGNTWIARYCSQSKF